MTRESESECSCTLCRPRDSKAGFLREEKEEKEGWFLERREGGLAF